MRSPSPDEQFPPSLGRPSQGLLHLLPGLAGGLDGLGVLPVTGSMTPHGEGCLPRRGERGRPEGGAHGDEQAEGLQPEWKQQRVSSGA